MKKLLLSTVAIGALALASFPSFAAEEGGVKLELGGYYKAYLGYLDQDELVGAGNSEVESTGYLQDSEIHFGGETTLDNGLLVGAHFEMYADSGDTAIQESYAYFSGDWGRVNIGAEDGAAFLLQVAAPSADSNYDGIRQTINPFNYTAAAVDGGIVDHNAWDYAQDPTADSEKITYLSPVFSGFQAGLTYTPNSDSDSSSALGFDTESLTGLGDGFEGAVRYEGAFDEVGMILGAGYSLLDSDNSAFDNRDIWNVGATFTFRAFSLGLIYKGDDQENLGEDREVDTWVVGADYTTGPFKIGASYFNEQEDLTATTDVDTDRYTGGVVYTYGPGMTFRGSISYVEHDLVDDADDVDGTTVLVGTQINF